MNKTPLTLMVEVPDDMQLSIQIVAAIKNALDHPAFESVSEHDKSRALEYVSGFYEQFKEG